MSENNSSNQAGNSSGNTPKRPPETPKPKSVGKLRRDGQGYND